MTRSWNAIGCLEAVDGENTKQTQFLGKPSPFNNLARRVDLDFEIRSLLLLWCTLSVCPGTEPRV